MALVTDSVADTTAAGTEVSLRDFALWRVYSVIHASPTHDPARSMLFRSLVFVGVILSFATQVAYATAPLSLDDAVRQALAHNRDLAAVSLGPEAARGRVDQAILKPNPSLEAGAQSDLITGNTGVRKFDLGLTQAIPLGDRLRQAQAVARVDVASASAGFADRQRRLVGEVTEVVVVLLALDRQIALRERLIDVNRRLVDLARARAKVGEVSLVEVNAAALELARLEPERATLLVERTSQVQRLRPRLGLSPDEPLEIADDLDKVLSTFVSNADGDKATWNRPDLLSAAFTIERVDAEQRVARAEVRGDLKVGATYGYGRGATGGADHLLGVKMSIPLPVRNKNQGRLRELSAERTRAQRELEARELVVASEVAVARQRAAQFQKILEGYRISLLPLGESAERDLVTAYQQGQVPLFQVIQSQQQRLVLEAGAIEATAAYARALADLQTVTGRNPQLASAPAADAQP